MGFYGGLGSLQDPPYHQVNHTGGSAHKIDHLGVAHIAHICVVHLEIENKRLILYGFKETDYLGNILICFLVASNM